MPSGKPLDRRMLLAAAGYAGSAAVCCVLASTRHAPFGDLRIYRSGGIAVLRGARLYDLRFAWNLGFTYPPFAALAFTLFAAAPWPFVPPLVTAVSAVLLPVTLWLALRLRPVRLASWPAARIALGFAAAALWLEPVRTNLAYGQINIVIAALVLADLSRGDAAKLKGAGIGLAAGLKLTPAIFGIYLLATGRYRAARTSAAAFAVTVAAGFAVLPADSSRFWAGTFADPMRVGRIENAANQSLRGALARVLHTTNVAPAWLALAAVAGVTGLTLAAIAGRRGNEAAGYSLTAVTGLLVSPVSWSHHWVLAVPALALLAWYAWRNRSRLALAAAAAAAVTGWSAIIWAVPVGLHRHAELRLNAPQLAAADAYVLIGLAVLAVSAGWLVRHRAPPARTAPAACPAAAGFPDTSPALAPGGGHAAGPAGDSGPADPRVTTWPG